MLGDARRLVIHGVQDEFNLLAVRQQLKSWGSETSNDPLSSGSVQSIRICRGPFACRPAILKTAGQAPRVEGHVIGRAGRTRTGTCSAQTLMSIFLDNVTVLPAGL